MRFLILALALVPFTTSAKDWLSHEYTESHWSIAAGWDFIHTEDEDDEAQALDKEYYEVRYRGQLYTLELAFMALRDRFYLDGESNLLSPTL
jgi:hypothetical protein